MALGSVGLICGFLLALMVVIAPSAQAQTFTVLYNFTGGSDGGYPYGGLIQDANGNLYGTTSAGGASNYGTVFKVTPTGTETVLYSFAGGSDGKYPYAGVILDSEGNVYGTTYQGGASNDGTVFKVNASGGESVLHSFTGGTTDGCNPGSGLIFDSQGNLYGDTQLCGASNYGTVFEVTPAGQETVLHSFAAGMTDGAEPFYGSLLLNNGYLYGVTQHGGTGNGCNLNCGVLFKLSMSGTLTVLHSFANSPDGSFPFGTPVMDAEGSIYGTTEAGDQDELGIVWKMNRNGTETILHSFFGGAEDGAAPEGGVVLDSQGGAAVGGNLYGTSEAGGASGNGIVYKLSKAGELTILHSFAGPEGEWPFDSLVRDAQGNLYGTASGGGSGSSGTVWKLTP
jgi:uncharacterized repeat protein (TIGR03803 family)